MSEPLSWCTSCWQDCPGLDPEGYCWDTNHREINARLARYRREDGRGPALPAPIVARPLARLPRSVFRVPLAGQSALELELPPVVAVTVTDSGQVALEMDA